MRIFLAEDNICDAMLVEEALSRYGVSCSVERYAGAEEAIRALRSCGAEGGSPLPDLILLDYNLVGGHGCQILASAAENEKLKSVPKAIISSFVRPEDMEEARRLGANAFIAKPANLDEFVAEVGSKITEMMNPTKFPPSSTSSRRGQSEYKPAELRRPDKQTDKQVRPSARR